nr:nsp12 [SARS coronavirus Tor2]
SADASTFFFF